MSIIGSSSYIGCSMVHLACKHYVLDSYSYVVVVVARIEIIIVIILSPGRVCVCFEYTRVVFILKILYLHRRDAM